jgi:hypothetical protein
VKAAAKWIPGPPPGPGIYWVFWRRGVVAVEIGPALIHRGDPAASLLIKTLGGAAYLYEPNRDAVTHHMPMMPPGAPS